MDLGEQKKLISGGVCHVKVVEGTGVAAQLQRWLRSGWARDMSGNNAEAMLTGVYSLVRQGKVGRVG